MLLEITARPQHEYCDHHQTESEKPAPLDQALGDAEALQLGEREDKKGCNFRAVGITKIVGHDMFFRRARCG